MVDDRPEESGSLPDQDRPKREPPTIDLEATEISSQTHHAAADVPPDPAPEAAAPSPTPVPRPISPWVIAPVSGAVAAALVIGIGWMLGWPAVQPAAPQLNAAAIDDLTGRVAGLESKAGKPAADPAAAARTENLEKSLATLRAELATTRAQSEKLAAAINDVKATPRDGTAAAPDVSVINERIAKIEGAVRAQTAEIAQQGSKIADTQAAEAKPADDILLRRVVASALLDVLVRVGDPYPAALAAAKALAPDAEALKPLDAFAAKGVPNAAKLSSEFLVLVPKLSPAVPDTATTGSGIVERLQAGAAKLVRIERTDTAGNDRGAVVARATAAALHNDFNGARRELNLLAPADRAAVQGWLERADARDAALAASRQFSADAMAAFAKPAQ